MQFRFVLDPKELNDLRTSHALIQNELSPHPPIEDKVKYCTWNLEVILFVWWVSQPTNLRQNIFEEYAFCPIFIKYLSDSEFIKDSSVYKKNEK